MQYTSTSKLSEFSEYSEFDLICQILETWLSHHIAVCGQPLSNSKDAKKLRPAAALRSHTRAQKELRLLFTRRGAAMKRLHSFSLREKLLFGELRLKFDKKIQVFSRKVTLLKEKLKKI